MCAYNGGFYRVGEAWSSGCANCSCEAGGGTRCLPAPCPPCPPGLFRDGRSRPAALDAAGECCAPCIRDSETQVRACRLKWGREA